MAQQHIMMNKIADTLVNAGLLGKEPVLTQSPSAELREFASVTVNEQHEILSQSEQLIASAEAIVAQAPATPIQPQRSYNSVV